MSGGGDKTEKPTPKKLREARKEGRVARTQDLGAWGGILTASVVLPLSAQGGAERVQALLVEAAALVEDPQVPSALRLVGEGFRAAAWMALPLALSLVVVVLAAGAAQGGVHAATKNLKPQVKRLNPMSGAKRIFGPNALWEAAKSLVKSSIVAVLVWRAVRDLAPELAAAGALPLASSLAVVGDSVAVLVRNVAFAGLVMALADYAWQHRRTAKQLRMTKQEVKDEHKQAEGDPHVKGQRRARQLAMSRNRMMAEVGKADVVLVNPIHVAVALRYDPAKGAPRVVAKGAGAMAARIRAEADRHRVPMVSDVPLARTLHGACELGQEIPAELYAAVARVLAFVMALKARGSAAGTHRVTALPARVSQ